MPDNNKTGEFLQKLAPCIERSELEACVKEAARLAGEMGIRAEELLKSSAEKEKGNEYEFEKSTEYRFTEAKSQFEFERG